MPSLPFQIPRVRHFLWFKLSEGVKIIGIIEILLSWGFLFLHGATILSLMSGDNSMKGMGRSEAYNAPWKRNFGIAAWLLVSFVDVTSTVIAICLLFGVFKETLCLIETWVRIKCFLIFTPIVSVLILVFFEDYLVIVLSYTSTTALFCYFVVVVNSYAYHLELGDLDQLSED